MRDFPKGPMEKGMFAASNVAFTGSKEPEEKTLIEISPALNVTENTPPMFLWATSEDTLVPVQHTLRMAHALADKNIPFEVHVFEKGPHGLSLSNQATAQARSQVYPDAAKWVGLAEAWLEKRLAIQLPELTSWETMGQ
jgi:dipeptidyl aminopeptidase/acylaminoacyl peptidase